MDGPEARRRYEEALAVVEQVREGYGKEAVMEQLMLILGAKIERVIINGGAVARKAAKANDKAAVAEFRSVVIPEVQRAADVGNPATYRVRTQCPLYGYSLGELDPKNIGEVLSTRRAILDPQDVMMMEAFYAQYLANQVRTQETMSFSKVSTDDDDLPF